MAQTPRKTYRIPEPQLAKIAELAERWGGVIPATETAVLLRLIDRGHEEEFGKPKNHKTA